MVGMIENQSQNHNPAQVEILGSDSDLGKGLVPKFHKMRKPERPDRAMLEEQLAKIAEDIDALQARNYEIKVEIANKQLNKNLALQELIDARGKLSSLSVAFRTAVDEKRALKEELDFADKMRDRMRTDARALREKLPYVKVDQIDAEIKKLEYKMAHTSLQIQEEKKLVQQIKDLSKSRDFVKDYSERMDHISQDGSSRVEILEKIKAKDKFLNDLKAQQEEQKKNLADIRAREASWSADIPILIKERATAYEKISSLREEINRLKYEFNLKEREFISKDREWRKQQAIERRIKFEKREAERKEREKLKKEKELENYVEPYTDEIILCGQLSSFLQKFVPFEDDVNGLVVSKAEILPPKGFGDFVLSKKNRADEELEGWFGGVGNKGKCKKSKALLPAKTREKERLSLPLDVLSSFQKIELDPPLTVGDVINTLECIRVKKEGFAKRQDDARQTQSDNSEDCTDVEAGSTEKGLDEVQPVGNELDEIQSVENELCETQQVENGHGEIQQDDI